MSEQPGWIRRKIERLISDPAFWDEPPIQRPVRAPKPVRRRAWWEPTSGRVLFERGLSSGGYHETIFRLGRWVLNFVHDTKHWHGSRYFSVHLRREAEPDQ